MQSTFGVQQNNLTVPARVDPAVKYRFDVVAGRLGLGLGSFSKVSGIKEQIEVVEMRDGQNPLQVRKIVGTHQGGTIVLEKGVIKDVGILTSWFRAVKESDPDGFRSDVGIGVADIRNRLVRVIVLQNAWPSAYEIGDLDGSSSEVEVESLSLVFESLEFRSDIEGRLAPTLLDLLTTQSG